MNRILSGIVFAAVVSFAGAAHAADIPARMPAKATPNEVVAYNWGGFYTASTLGGGWQNIDGRTIAGTHHIRRGIDAPEPAAGVLICVGPTRAVSWSNRAAAAGPRPSISASSVSAL